MYGKDFGYANTRVTGTVVRLIKGGEPVLVNTITNSGLCSVTLLENIEAGDSTTVHLDDLNLEPVPLGYVNHNGKAIYLQRIPVRRGPGNQGLNANNCISTGERLWRFPNKALRQCIMGKYPDFKTAFKSANGINKFNLEKSIAFDRHWAVSEERLYYKNNLLVGIIKDGKPSLLPEFKYLRECLAEIV
jgi:hypothetical protein